MTDDVYRLSLPMPPSLHAYYLNAKRKAKSGKTFNAKMISPEGLRFRGEVLCEVRRGHQRPPKIEGPLDIVVLVCKSATNRDGSKATLRKGDLDNLWKCLLDALTEAEVIGDDVQFDDIRMIRGNALHEGKVFLAIRRFDPDRSLRAAAEVGLPFRREFAGAIGELPF